jgi:Cd2+/Zn2+-exporting ATPase
VLLVIACPCALVLATPVTVVSGLAAAARRGILIKGGVYLEEARKLRVIALDKTGTITEGKPRLVATELLPSTVPESQVLAWAASLAGHSDHPVSKAIATGLKLPENGLTDFVALAGRGIEARTDGQLLDLGNHRLIEERKLCSAEIEARLQVHETQGRTVTMLASATAGAGDFCGGGHHQGKLTGGGGRSAPSRCRLGHADRRQCGDGREHRQGSRHRRRPGQSSPEDKLAAIEDLQRRYGPTAMTGDGINDAPALAVPTSAWPWARPARIRRWKRPTW